MALDGWVVWVKGREKVKSYPSSSKLLQRRPSQKCSNAACWVQSEVSEVWSLGRGPSSGIRRWPWRVICVRERNSCGAIKRKVVDEG